MAVWTPGKPLLEPGVAYSLALVATVVIEGFIALVYAAVRGECVTLWLTNVLLVNLITHPALWFVMGRQVGDFSYFFTFAVAEAGVWLVEAALLYLLRGGRLALKEALVLSLILNAFTAGVGLVLPA